MTEANASVKPERLELAKAEACIECNAPRNGETFVRGQCAACVQAENRWFADGGQRIGPSTTRRSHEGEDEQDAGEDDEEDEDMEKKNKNRSVSERLSRRRPPPQRGRAQAP